MSLALWGLIIFHVLVWVGLVNFCKKTNQEQFKKFKLATIMFMFFWPLFLAKSCIALAFTDIDKDTQ